MPYGDLLLSYDRKIGAKIAFALQNTEHGPVERRVFTYNNHINKYTYNNEKIKEMTQKQLYYQFG